MILTTKEFQNQSVGGEVMGKGVVAPFLRTCYCPSVCLSSVKFVRPTQAVQIFGNISTELGTLAIH